MTTEDTLKQFREMLYKYNSIPVTHRFGIEKKMIDKLESFLRDALDQAYVEAQKDLLKDYKKDIAQARQEERAYIGKQKREWFMRGVKEERERIEKALQPALDDFNAAGQQMIETSVLKRTGTEMIENV